MIEEIYNREFFNVHTGWRDDYDRLAISLLWHLDFDHVADFGCGNGYLVGALQSAGKKILAVDGSEAAKGYIPWLKVVVADLCNHLDFFRKFDLVCCIEVAEHLDEQYALVLVDNICRHAIKWVVFSAAEPGFGGYHHLNEQPRSYWEKMFESYGFKMHRNKTFQIKWELRHSCEYTFWFAKNIMVLRRQE